MIIENITLRRGRARLVAGGDLPLEHGKVTVLFGASGCGKSTLLYALADLDPAVHFTCHGDGQPLTHERVGLVPQQSAVFEDLGRAEHNIRFAHAHAGPQAATESEDQVLDRAEEHLGVRRDWTFPLSGGQKQRVAIARALAGKASVLLCDEPTSGLDPHSRREAIEAIRRAAEDGVAVLVVTHDPEWNRAEVAEHAVVLRAGRLQRHTPGEKLPIGPPDAAPAATADPEDTALLRTAEHIGTALWWVLFFPVEIARGLWGPGRVARRWLGVHLRHFTRIVLGFSSLVYLAAGGALVGFSGLYFSVGALAAAPHLREILYPELLSGTAYGLYRVIIPLITALLVSAKCGSAIAADIGNRQYGGQIAVMRTLTASPETHLLFSAMLTLAIGMPLLNLLAFACAALGSLSGFLLQFPTETAYAWSNDFLRLLRPRPGHWLLAGTGWNAAKLALAGAGVGLLSYRLGITPKTSHTDVGRDISRATLWGSLWCLAVFTLFAFFEF